MKIETIKTVIQCPECNAIQEAKVEKTNEYPYFDTHIHTCNSCGYVIMESEWQEVLKTGVYIVFNDTNACAENIEKQLEFKFKSNRELLEKWATTCAINLTGFSCKEVAKYLLEKCENEYMNMSDAEFTQTMLFWKDVMLMQLKKHPDTKLLFSNDEISPRNLVSVVYNHKLYHGAMGFINRHVKEYKFKKDGKLHIFTPKVPEK